MAPSKPDENQPLEIKNLRVVRIRTIKDRLELAKMPRFRRTHPPCSDEMQFGKERKKISIPKMGLADPPEKS